jgi:hypothetical protein
MKKLLAALAALSVLAAPAWAVWYAGNALAVSDTSAQVTFATADCSGGVCASVSVYNSGANPAYVKVWDKCEGTIAAITTASAGAILIPAGGTYSFDHDKRTECGGGYKGFSRIAGAGLTTTLNVVGK